MESPINAVLVILLVAVVVGLCWAAQQAVSKERDFTLAYVLLTVAACFDGVAFCLHVFSS